MKNNTKKPKISWVNILAFAALGFVIIGGSFAFSTYQFTKHALATSGRVISVSPSYRDGQLLYHPTISYVDYDGIKRSEPSYRASRSYNFRTGEKVEILYDIRNSREFRVNDPFVLWSSGLVFLGIGLAIGGGALALSRRNGGSSRITRQTKPRKQSIEAKHIMDHTSKPKTQSSVVRRMR